MMSTNYAKSAYNNDAKDMGFRVVTLAYDVDAIDIFDFRDVTLAYDDDAKDIIVSRDETLAYDDDAKDIMGFRDVTLAYDDDAEDIMGCGCTFAYTIMLIERLFQFEILQWTTPLMKTSSVFLGRQLEQGWRGRNGLPKMTRVERRQKR